MNERRHATRPHYASSAERDFANAAAITIGLSFITGAMLGAAMAIGWLS